MLNQQHLPGPRLRRERKTMAVMIALYCRKQHGGKHQLCSACQELYEYALQRLEKCPFGEGKTTCAKCTVHCYKSAMRERVRNVMRYSGPRMIYRHPLLAISHIVDGIRGKPNISRRK